MSTATSRRPELTRMLSKVPEVTLYFWVIKILATTVGETAADFLNTNLNMGLTGTTLIMSGLLAIALGFQFRARKYVPGLYWLAVVLISIVGTLITDNLVDNLGVSLWACTIGFGAAMLATFAVWYSSEKTLSIHSITTTKREAFYWLAILFTFALGTAAGDLIAEGLNIGYFNSVLLFSAMIGLVYVAYRFLNVNEVLAFWAAYVLTRPLGASMGDLLSQPKADGGLGLGTTVTSFVFLVAILVVVIYMTSAQKKQAITAAA
ncbi:MAG: putative membrane-anchored protein [Acidimicrobiaceae bacterium]|nr:MAG: putative membrane-anchored protein [Acidimicrobiaceae bacterium]